MEKATAPHSSTLVWKIPWMEEPGRLQLMESQRVRHDWVTSLSCTGEGNGNPLQCSFLENPRDGGPGRLPSMGSQRVRHDWSDLAAAADHYIYYCGQESPRRNGVAIIVNKRVQNAVLGCSLKNERMISASFQGKPFNITVIQVYAPTSKAEEAEVELFYEDL